MSKRKAIYLEDFGSVQDVNRKFQEGVYNLATRDFDYPIQHVTEKELLFAWYGGGGYDGTAFVLFRRDGVLYEVNASHCSCNGLEDQWKPEATSKKALLFRIEKGYLGKDSYTSGGMFADQLLALLATIREKRNG
jgi:hypothetical protein